MLGAVDLRRLRKDRRAALANQHVGGHAQRRVGGDAGIAVRAAALQRQRDLGGRHRLAPGARHDGQHLLDALDAPRDHLPGAADLLDGHGLEGVAVVDAVDFLHPADLEGLAAEPDQQRAAEIRVGRVAPLRPAQHVEAFALEVHGAAGAVDERHDAVDRRIVVEDARARDFLRHEFGDGRRAVHAGQDAEIVARPDLAVGAPETLERRALGSPARSPSAACRRRNA